MDLMLTWAEQVLRKKQTAGSSVREGLISVCHIRGHQGTYLTETTNLPELSHTTDSAVQIVTGICHCCIKEAIR